MLEGLGEGHFECGGENTRTIRTSPLDSSIQDSKDSHFES